MKKITYFFLIFIVFISCNKETNYVTLSGTIANKNSDSLLIFNPKTNFSKIIKLKNDGTFKDTIKLENGLFSMSDSKEFTQLYLINGDHVTINYDAKHFEKGIEFTGKYNKENVFLNKSLINETDFFSDTNLMRLSKADFNNKVSNYVNDFNTRLVSEKLDSFFVDFQKKEIIQVKEYIEQEYEEKNYAKLYLGKGKPSPKFIDYENFNGSTTSLDDLKGKYVYVDVWATWCQPCKAEIPYLKKIEEDFKEKNIEFVSVSIDDKRSHEAWMQMVMDKELGGIQLYAKGDRKFTSAYKINSIPRFILIDPESNIVNANAPRPSSPQLRSLLNSLNL